MKIFYFYNNICSELFEIILKELILRTKSAYRKRDMEREELLYASVVLPIRFSQQVFYYLPAFLLPEHIVRNRSQNNIESLIGCWVEVRFGNRTYNGIIRKIATDSSIAIPDNSKLSSQTIEFKPIIALLTQRPKVSVAEMLLWERIASYYLCTFGEVFKAAYPILTQKQEEVCSKKLPEDIFSAIASQSIAQQIKLSTAQQEAYSSIKEGLQTKTVLLHGITGSGKTEIYIKLANEYIAAGKDVLYLVPEISLSKQLEKRLKQHFGERVLIFHSAASLAVKKLVRSTISAEQKSSQIKREPLVVLGTRSSIFLPFNNLGLVIVDEEHDLSYKQEEPAPRYNARDAALFLANIHKAGVLLGSATPSFESIYNCLTGKFHRVLLTEKFYNSPPPQITIIDTIWTTKSRQMRGSFSQQLVNRIADCIAKGEQTLVFRNIRSYSPILQCSECGEIIRCPHCNVALSYHKYDNSLRCHYCEYKREFSNICPKCNNRSIDVKGAGTERLEEELKELFPGARVARYDADIAKSKRESQRILEEFSAGKIDILVGTQMITKGFDFPKLTLVAVIGADTILSQQDFRADERALQLLVQLVGRSGRRGNAGQIIIQTGQKNHPVLGLLGENANRDDYNNLLAERKLYLFPPFVRLVNIVLKHKNHHKLEQAALSLTTVLKNSGAINPIEINGPFSPRIEKIRDEYIKCLSVKFRRDANLQRNKIALANIIEKMKLPLHIYLDVDPA